MPAMFCTLPPAADTRHVPRVLILHHSSEGMVKEDKIHALIKAAGVNVDRFWPDSFAKALANVNIGALSAVVGAGGPAAPAAGLSEAFARRRLLKGLVPEQTGTQLPAFDGPWWDVSSLPQRFLLCHSTAMAQMLSSSRHWRCELSVPQAQSATPATPILGGGGGLLLRAGSVSGLAECLLCRRGDGGSLGSGRRVALASSPWLCPGHGGPLGDREAVLQPLRPSAGRGGDGGPTSHGSSEAPSGALRFPACFARYHAISHDGLLAWLPPTAVPCQPSCGNVAQGRDTT
ncbi:hypothetical protein QTO34_004446 [Cnephaeus nilssonii]|uniref:Large ribosomal subunit protein P2 n=1 Tax=Cnephaeus nilssonii TaxID=3371016 RepID=A0AA40LJD3_CNENI|nr:hypothetical protein QTO34_004446 [Eptesicus nilssonii]